MLKWLASITVLLLAAHASADTVVLKTGQVLAGKVLSNDDKGVVLQVEFGTMLITQDKILRIEEDTAEILALREKESEDKREFAAKMKADGKVQYKGKWVTEKEKEAEEAKIADAKKKKEDEIAAKKKAEEAEQKKQQAEAAKLAAQQRQQPPQQQNTRGNRGNDGRTQRGSSTDRTQQALDHLRQQGINTDQIQNFINNNR
jgi:outer membrane biosynthesis protein TonB